VVTTLAVLGALIGSVSFTGSCVALGQAAGPAEEGLPLPAQNVVNVVLALDAAIAVVAR
jgi:NAD(P) transhydrogenase subunit beta